MADITKKRRLKRDIKNAFAIRDELIDTFNRFYYDSWDKTWGNTFYFGIETFKYPTDLWTYQEIIHRTKPDFIIESGTYKGGTALYLANLCDALNHGTVITLDNFQYRQKIDKKTLKHERIRFIKGDSVSQKTISNIKKIVGKNARVMVILDSDHKKSHVLKELNLYSKLVTKDNYLVLEDTNINGHPSYEKFGPGPMEALREFMKKNKKFVSDRRMEKFYITTNPEGYLLRKK